MEKISKIIIAIIGVVMFGLILNKPLSLEIIIAGVSLLAGLAALFNKNELDKNLIIALFVLISIFIFKEAVIGILLTSFLLTLTVSRIAKNNVISYSKAIFVGYILSVTFIMYTTKFYEVSSLFFAIMLSLAFIINTSFVKPQNMLSLFTVATGLVVFVSVAIIKKGQYDFPLALFIANSLYPFVILIIQGTQKNESDNLLEDIKDNFGYGNILHNELH